MKEYLQYLKKNVHHIFLDVKIQRRSTVLGIMPNHLVPHRSDPEKAHTDGDRGLEGGIQISVLVRLKILGNGVLIPMDKCVIVKYFQRINGGGEQRGNLRLAIFRQTIRVKNKRVRQVALSMAVKSVKQRVLQRAVINPVCGIIVVVKAICHTKMVECRIGGGPQTILYGLFFLTVRI